MTMISCAIPGCNSSIEKYDESTRITFHKLPRTVVHRTAWFQALGPLSNDDNVCSLHFEASMFTNQSGRRTLKRDAVPKQVLNLDFKNEPSPASPASPHSPHSPPSPLPPPSPPPLVPRQKNRPWADPVVACRVCLVTDVRLQAIRNTAVEDSLAMLTGIEVTSEKGFPRHLCEMCAAQLTKFTAFRDKCERSTALLWALRKKKKGALLKCDIATIDREMHQLTHFNLTKAYDFNTEYLPPPFPVENESVDKQKETEYTDVEYLDSDLIHEVPGVEKEVVVNDDTIDDDFDWSEANDDFDADEDMREIPVVSKKNKRKVEKVNENQVYETDAEFEAKYNCKIKVLTQEEQKEFIENRRRNNKSLFPCLECGRAFSTLSTLRKHKERHDPALPLGCDVCRLRFRRRYELLLHLKMHRATYTCLQCGFVSRIKTQAKDHSLSHMGVTYSCEYCGKLFHRRTTFFNHLRNVHLDRHEPCDECGDTYVAGLGIAKHKAFKHKRLSVCRVCRKVFTSAEALARHKLPRGGMHAKWPCTKCGENCESEEALARHKADEHPPGGEHYCKKCNMSFSNAEAFRLHAQRKHTEPRRRGPCHALVCYVCGKKFTCGTLLQDHLNVHLGLTPYGCAHCPKTFASKSKLVIHLRVHTGERPYECEYCSNTFTLQGNYRRHVKNVHLNLCVKCQLCGKSVKQASLREHVRSVHLNVRYQRKPRTRTKITLDDY